MPSSAYKELTRLLSVGFKTTNIKEEWDALHNTVIATITVQNQSATNFMINVIASDQDFLELAHKLVANGFKWP